MVDVGVGRGADDARSDSLFAGSFPGDEDAVRRQGEVHAERLCHRFGVGELWVDLGHANLCRQIWVGRRDRLKGGRRRGRQQFQVLQGRQCRQGSASWDIDVVHVLSFPIRCMHPFNRRAQQSRLSTVCVAVATPSEGGRNPLRLFLGNSVFREYRSFGL